jgi:hypothetical protein
MSSCDVDNPFSFTNTPPSPGGMWTNLVHLLIIWSQKIWWGERHSFSDDFPTFSLETFELPSQAV